MNASSYGIPPNSISKENWHCHACAAVGTNICIVKPSKVRKYKNKNPTKELPTDYYMRQTARPRDCALCSIMTGKHAMHPLYNTGGTDGCHRVLAAQPARGLVKRTAWVHTACAVAISTSRKLGGCVYGCFEDGTYEEDSGYADDDEEHEFDCDETTVAATAVATVAPSNIQHKNKEDPDSTVDTTGTGSTPPHPIPTH